jgi:hemerythrin-like domain-containing protein
MPVILGAKAQAGFDQPLELLKDCHRRIEHFLDILLRVARGERLLDDQRRRALEAALTYFREAAPRHTRDEEESLFPRLRESSAREVHTSLEQLATLEADHLRADALHDRANALVAQWLRDGQLSEPARRELVTHLQALRDLYRAHIHLEDDVIFPLAARALDNRQLAAIGDEMRTRRNPSTSTAAASHASTPGKESS